MTIRRTPVLLQMEAVECGAAALGIILSYHGLYLPLEVLREDCGVTRNGSRASNMVKAARSLGMTAGGLRVDADGLRSLDMPVILYWEFNHFLVLEGFKGNKVYLNDPARGHRTVTMDEFRGSYTGVALTFSPGPDFKKGGKKRGSVKTMARMLLQEKAGAAFLMIVGFLMIVPGLAMPALTQSFLDDILTQKHPEWLFDVLLIMGGVCLLNGAFVFMRSWCLTRWQTKLTLVGSSRFVWHVLRLPMAFFLQRFTGEIAMRVSLNESVASVVTGEGATVLLDFLTAVFYVLLLLCYSWRLALIGVAFSMANFCVLYFGREYLLEASMKVRQDYGRLAGTAVSGVQAMETLKANGNEADFFTKWSGYNAKYVEGMQKLSIVNQIFSIVPVFLSGLNTAIIMMIGGIEIIDGIMTTGVFIAFRGLMDNFQTPLGKMIGLSQSLQDAESQMQRLDDVLDYALDADELQKDAETDVHAAKLTGNVELRDVTFGYSPLEPPLIENFNLSLSPGRWVALVGDSGCGKSTLIRMVSGLYKPWSGQILFDGRERKDIPRNAIVSSLACVDQDIYLFAGTVRENISLFDSGVAADDIVQGAKDAEIHNVIEKLDGAYAHAVTEGGLNFSGGQRQRMEIARALATNPSILILDEATSALDPITEEQVMANIKKRGCACLMSAHRLSAFRDCDEIIVLRQGKVLQRGTHKEMLGVEGPYRELIAERGEE